MEQPYTIPAQTRIGHIHLKVANLQRALDFYSGILGFELIKTYGSDAAFISAGGYHHHIGLNTWYSKNAPPAPVRSAGLFHTAILYPTRKDLVVAYKRLLVTMQKWVCSALPIPASILQKLHSAGILR